MDGTEVDNKFLNANKKFLEYKNKEIERLQEEIKENKKVIARLMEQQTTEDVQELKEENEILQADLDYTRYKLLEIMSKLPESNFEVKPLSIEDPNYEVTIYKETEIIKITIDDESLEEIVNLVETAQATYKDK